MKNLMTKTSPNLEESGASSTDPNIDNEPTILMNDELPIPRASRSVIRAEFTGVIDDGLPVPDFFTHTASRLASEAVSGETERRGRDTIHDILGGEGFARLELDGLECGEALTEVAELAEDGEDDASVVVSGTDSSDALAVSTVDGFSISIPLVGR